MLLVESDRVCRKVGCAVTLLLAELLSNLSEV